MQMRYLTNVSKISDKPNNIISDKGKLNFYNTNDEAGHIQQMQIADYYKKCYERKRTTL